MFNNKSLLQLIIFAISLNNALIAPDGSLVKKAKLAAESAADLLNYTDKIGEVKKGILFFREAIDCEKEAPLSAGLITKHFNKIYDIVSNAAFKIVPKYSVQELEQLDAFFRLIFPELSTKPRIF